MLNVSLTVSEAAEVLQVNPRTLQSWVPLLPQEHVGGGGVRGRHRHFSLPSLMLAALAIKLMRTGFAAAPAFQAAMTFSHLGHDAGADVTPARMPAFPYFYREGDTYLYAAGEAATVRLVSVLSQVDQRAVEAALGNPDAFVAVNASKVFSNVVIRLGENPAEVLDAVYPEKPD